MTMPDELCHAEGAAGIARGWLYPEAFEWAFPKDAAITDAVQRDTASHAEILEPSKTIRCARHS